MIIMINHDHEHSIFAYVMMGCFFSATGGANASALFDASRTCGAAGEWKRRVAEELSAVYFVGGWEVPKKGWNRVCLPVSLALYYIHL